MADTSGVDGDCEYMPAASSSDLDVAKALGARLRELRESAGVTQERASQIAHMSRNHYQLLEQGLSDRKKDSPANPRLSTLVALCDAYETTVPQLMIDIFTPSVQVEVSATEPR